MLQPHGAKGFVSADENRGSGQQPHSEKKLLGSEMTPKPNGFWQFNAGHAATILTTVVGLLGMWTAGVREFDSTEARITALERSDKSYEVSLNPLPGRVTVLETRIDILQAQLNQLTMSSNRTADAIIGMREDIASIKASLAARGN